MFGHTISEASACLANAGQGVKLPLDDVARDLVGQADVGRAVSDVLDATRDREGIEVVAILQTVFLGTALCVAIWLLGKKGQDCRRDAEPAGGSPSSGAEQPAVG